MPSSGVLYPIEMTILDLGGSCQFDLSVTDSSNSTVYTDTTIVTHPDSISTLHFGRQGTAVETSYTTT